MSSSHTDRTDCENRLDPCGGSLVVQLSMHFYTNQSTCCTHNRAWHVHEAIQDSKDSRKMDAGSCTATEGYCVDRACVEDKLNDHD